MCAVGQMDCVFTAMLDVEVCSLSTQGDNFFLPGTEAGHQTFKQNTNAGSMLL